MPSLQEIFLKPTLSHADVVSLLCVEGDDRQQLFREAAAVKERCVGNVVYFRGLIELSNVCRKDCYYCGIRFSNDNLERYNLTDDEVLHAVRFAHENRYASVVIQSGEIMGDGFTSRIERLVDAIKRETNGEIGITLSLGEQTEETYRRWFDAGAHRYLLRIESSNRELYKKIHPDNSDHRFESRLEALRLLRAVGYQVGTGVMIGLPFQTIDDLARDLLFMRDFDIDMCGMGPYIEHPDTPMYRHREILLPASERFDLALKMIATLRILMKDINIAAATAMQALDPLGREKAIKVGANIVMPNITPGKYRNYYKLYENKPCTDEAAEDCTTCLDARISMTGNRVGYGEWGDSKHFTKNEERQ